MKKILACIICLTLAFGVTACGKASDKDSTEIPRSSPMLRTSRRILRVILRKK